MEKLTYYSQYDQDKFADIYFRKKQNGFFLDIGANDGISCSNTFFLEKERGWSGICIEPIPDVFNQLNSIRKSINFNVCISEEEGFVNFRRVHGTSEMLSGIVEFMTPDHIKRIKEECDLSNGSFEDIKLESRNINSILESNNVNKIDFLSIDTEGAEFTIIKTIDFDKICITFLSVENNDSSEEIRKYLKSKGYKYIPFITDDFFIKDTNSLFIFKAKVVYFLAKKILKSKIKQLSGK
jgi:FkbM family methyltransferase